MLYISIKTIILSIATIVLVQIVKACPCACSETFREQDCSLVSNGCIWASGKCRLKQCSDLNQIQCQLGIPSTPSSEYKNCFWDGKICKKWEICSDQVADGSATSFQCLGNCSLRPDTSICQPITSMTIPNVNIKCTQQSQCKDGSFNDYYCIWNSNQCELISKTAECLAFTQQLCIQQRCYWNQSKCEDFSCNLAQSQEVCISKSSIDDGFCDWQNGKCLYVADNSSCEDRRSKRACEFSSIKCIFINDCFDKECSIMNCQKNTIYPLVYQKEYLFCKYDSTLKRCLDAEASLFSQDECLRDTNSSYSWDSQKCRRCGSSHIIIFGIAFLLYNLV